ncbi:MAG TPA: hypothetical protein ENJ54_00145 [Chloroflexi bacterium]|nr:hypothetical protein [Chloroflexota bacterium]
MFYLTFVYEAEGVWFTVRSYPLFSLDTLKVLWQEIKDFFANRSFLTDVSITLSRHDYSILLTELEN